MYSHIASNDTTEPLSFVGGWLVNTTVALVGGGYANYGTSGGKKWIDLQTDAQLIRLVGVDYQVKKGNPPSEDDDFFYWPVYPDKYLQVSKTARVDSVFSHTHQTSFDNVHGSGFKPTVGDIIGKKPVDLLSPIASTRVDGTKFADTIVLNNSGGTVYANNGADTVTGGDGGDLMFGGRGKDTLYGGLGRDRLNGDDGNDRLYGGADNDVLRGGAGKDRLYGGDGEDKLYGDWHDDTLYGGADNDWLYGGDDNDVLYGGIGQDVLDGGNGNDRLYGDADNDTLRGGSGDDRAYGGIGQDTIHGDGGNDRLYGDADNDWLYGGKGKDRLEGGVGNDFLYGGAGKDKLFGGAGNDRLDGGDGQDILNGGPGDDIFVFSTKLGNGNIDRVVDFEIGTDAVWLSKAIFKKLPLGPLSADHFHRGSKAADKNDYVVYDAKKGLLIYDKNGSGKGGAQVVAKFDKGTDLHNSDLYVKTPGELLL